tara:strand:+ start:2508 stop:3392 length:885 start_codon:yes stop_codon:yes gene_type:complete
MSKKEKTTETPKGDNLVDVLNDFNTGEGSQDKTEAVESVEEKKVENADVKESNSDKKVESEEKDDKWLINNKFKDNKEGAQKLATAYKELQSLRDKENASPDRERFEKFKQLDKIIEKHPSVAKAMQSELQRLADNQNKAPEKPEEYDILDEGVEGTESYKWRQAYDKYLVDMGRNAAREEVDALRHEMAQKQAAQTRILKLREKGLSDDDIKDYHTFMTDKKNLNDDTLVDVWKILTGKKDMATSNQETPISNAEPKRVTAAAVTGTAPEQVKPATKAKEEFWDGIMKSARKV